jgi:hypothetical protein
MTVNDVTTSGRITPHQETVERRQWEPIYDGERHSLPVAWQCPCGGLVHITSGRICCPDCGRIPRDPTFEKMDGTTISTTGRKGTEWRKFGKDGEMTKARREPRLVSKCTRC